MEGEGCGLGGAKPGRWEMSVLVGDGSGWGGGWTDKTVLPQITVMCFTQQQPVPSMNFLTAIRFGRFILFLSFYARLSFEIRSPISGQVSDATLVAWNTIRFPPALRIPNTKTLTIVRHLIIRFHV